jgi:hypothetical protein
MKLLSNRKKLTYWAGVFFSPFAMCFTGANFIYYAWLDMANPERHAAEKVEHIAYTYFGLTVLIFFVLVYCIYKLVKGAKRSHIN